MILNPFERVTVSLQHASMPHRYRGKSVGALGESVAATDLAVALDPVVFA